MSESREASGELGAGRVGVEQCEQALYGIVQFYSPSTEYSPEFTIVHRLEDRGRDSNPEEQIERLLESANAEPRAIVVRPEYEEFLEESYTRKLNHTESEGLVRYVSDSLSYDSRLFEALEELQTTKEFEGEF